MEPGLLQVVERRLPGLERVQFVHLLFELGRHTFAFAFPGVGCNCAPPDTNGEVGATQYVQMVNEGYQVFDKATGNSVLGPACISSLWVGFGGAWLERKIATARKMMATIVPAMRAEPGPRRCPSFI